MKKLNLVSYGKINLGLDVLAKRSDGYHEVQMVMQSIDLKDKLFFTKIEKGIEIITDHSKIPTDSSNLIYKAAQLLFEEFSLQGGLRVELKKNIPLAAGLAGGSSNAAATLVAVNKLWELALSEEELASRGAKLGADIPFCIKGGTQLASGIGTDLEVLDDSPELNIVLINPPLEVSTAEVYGSLNVDEIKQHPNIKSLIKALREGNKEDTLRNLGNVLEEVTLNLYPQVKKLKELANSLSVKTLMSGSGPTILAFVNGVKEGKEVKSRLKKHLGEEHVIELVKTTSQGIDNR
ncbi:4-(cytidine 5'-diphospho)-2-C-methyl-D-erythritol kinase [Halonatronum saccharophilum]|uniref:4-(cytidine 5'-diphospho)-2-C-methyl-D-erythritol kinase n=1 Tax=Halonatronum saccharophilum TaxID=150060 RepID=UPI00048720A0|nr:4-(cytidine 5'-diphospho)-2-C-methyl-D-erythritol kinase [Halonatronum saccharophilum]